MPPHPWRGVARLGAAVLLALSFSGCGGEKEAPDHASRDAFCAAMEEVVKANFAVDPEALTRAQWDEVVSAHEQLRVVGTPKGMPEPERDGFEILVDYMATVGYGAARQIMATDGDPGYPEGDVESVERFSSYALRFCTGRPLSAEGLPDCDQVWQVDKRLPKRYKGCAYGDEVAHDSIRDCPEKPRVRYVGHYARDGGVEYIAYTNGDVRVHDFEMDLKMLKACDPEVLD